MQQRNKRTCYLKIASAAALLFPALALGQARMPPSAPVTIVNTLSNPVPFTGSIINSPASPIPVSIRATNIPVTLKATVNLFGYNGSASAVNLNGSPFTVPTGKRLVVEYVSGETLLPTGQRGATFGLTDPSGSTVLVRIPFAFAGTIAADGIDDFAGGQLVTDYVEAGNAVVAYCARSVSEGAGQCAVSIVGQLVSAP